MVPLTVGPILGSQVLHEDHFSQRVFVRGAAGAQIAWVKLSQKGGGYSATQSELVAKERDYTHVFEFHDLPPDSEFDLYACTVDDAQEDAPLWAAPTHRFKTPAVDVQRTAFSFGSCRSPDRGADLLNDDRCFEVIAEHHLDDDFMLMCGDQIYADQTLKGWPIINKSKRLTREHYLSHYRKYFARPSFAKVVGSLPTYMMMDDHEVVNNWSKGAFDRKERGFKHRHILNNGLEAYRLYQASLANAGGHDPESYHYQFSHGRCDFFMMDQRTQRDIKANRRNKSGYDLILKNQMDDLKAFISDGADRVKFIVSPVPMLPDSGFFERLSFLNLKPKERWQGYSTQRGELLDAIRQEQAAGGNRNFVILSGDVHCASIYKLRHLRDPGFCIHQITSSAFNWTVFPGLNDRHFAEKKALRRNKDYIPENLSGRVVNEHNFCRVEVRDSIDVKIFNNSGVAVRHKVLPLI